MKHEIEIEGLPEGWEPVAYRHIRPDDEYVLIEGEIRAASNVNNLYEQLIVKKKQPRRIVLEETNEPAQKYESGRYPAQAVTESITLYNQPKIWREVKETDLSLHNSDDKESLRLTREQCRELLNFSSSAIEMIRDFLRSKQ